MPTIQSWKIEPLILCFITILVTVHPAGGQHSITAENLTGTYVIGSQYGGSSLTIKADGTFQKIAGAHVTYVAESGTYIRSNDVLQFTVRKASQNRVGEEIGKGVDLSVDDRRDFSLRLIQWGERRYLIYDSEFEGFVDTINLGIEPRPSLMTYDYVGDFYLREGDEKKDVKGQPTLPEKWRSLLLSSPVIANIVNIERIGAGRIAIIDKGSKDGLKVGMSMVSVHVDVYDRRLQKVISVEEKTAKVKINDDIVFGDQLTSRYEHRIGFGQ